MADPPPVRVPPAAAAAYFRDVRALYLGPMFAEMVESLARAAAAQQAYLLMGETVGALAAKPAGGVPVETIQRHLDDMADYHAHKVKATFGAALGVDVGTLLAKGPAAEFMRGKVADSVALIKTLPDTAKAKFGASLERLVADRPFDQQMVRRALRDAHNVTANRLKLITRDQTNKAMGGLTQIRQTQLGVDAYTWQTSEDQRVRPSHRDNAGSVFLWSEPPGTGHPGDDILCRCVAIASLDGLKARKPATGKPAQVPAGAAVQAAAAKKAAAKADAAAKKKADEAAAAAAKKADEAAGPPPGADEAAAAAKAAPAAAKPAPKSWDFTLGGDWTGEAGDLATRMANELQDAVAEQLRALLEMHAAVKAARAAKSLGAEMKDVHLTLAQAENNISNAAKFYAEAKRSAEATGDAALLARMDELAADAADFQRQIKAQVELARTLETDVSGFDKARAAAGVLDEDTLKTMIGTKLAESMGAPAFKLADTSQPSLGGASHRAGDPGIVMSHKTSERPRLRTRPPDQQEIEFTKDLPEISQLTRQFEDGVINRGEFVNSWLDAAREANNSALDGRHLGNGFSKWIPMPDAQNAFSIHWYEKADVTVLEKVTHEGIKAVTEARPLQLDAVTAGYMREISELSQTYRAAPGTSLYRGYRVNRSDPDYWHTEPNVDDVVLNVVPDSWSTQAAVADDFAGESFKYRTAAEAMADDAEDVSIVYRLHDPEGNQPLIGAIGEHRSFIHKESEFTMAQNQFLRVLERRDVVVAKRTRWETGYARRIEYDVEVVTAREAAELTGIQGTRIIGKEAALLDDLPDPAKFAQDAKGGYAAVAARVDAMADKAKDGETVSAAEVEAFVETARGLVASFVADWKGGKTARQLKKEWGGTVEDLMSQVIRVLRWAPHSRPLLSDTILKDTTAMYNIITDYDGGVPDWWGGVAAAS